MYGWQTFSAVVCVRTPYPVNGFSPITYTHFPSSLQVSTMFHYSYQMVIFLLNNEYPTSLCCWCWIQAQHFCFISSFGMAGREAEIKEAYNWLIRECSVCDIVSHRCILIWILLNCDPWQLFYLLLRYTNIVVTINMTYGQGQNVLFL